MKFLLLSALLCLLLLTACQQPTPPPPQTDPIDSTAPSVSLPDTPPATAAPDTDPPVTDPPAADPPVTDPPVTDPPVTDPPVTDPPQTKPPVTDPPEIGGPEDYPPEYAWVDHDIESVYFGTVLPEDEKAGDDYLEKVVFLGDSTTYGLRYYGILPNGKQTGQVWVPKNGTLTLYNVPEVKIYLADTDEEMVLTEALAARKPEILVITLGVNGVGWMSREVFVGEYRELIEAVRTVSPDTAIILQSIFPVRPDYAKLETINNRKISQANAWIAALAQECGLAYLNTAECLLNAYGYLKPGYDSGDGMHLMPAVYERIVDYLLRHPITIITDPTA